MAAWDAWMPELVLAAPGAPQPHIELCLNRAARTFCKTTRQWQEWLEPEEITGDRFQEYDFDLPQGAELYRLERATSGEMPLAVVNARDLSADPVLHAVYGSAYLITQDLESFRIGALRTGNSVQAYVTLIPSLSARSIPDSVSDRWHEAILEGAKSQLLNTHGTDYYNPDQAAVSTALFSGHMDEASTQVWRSSTDRVSRGSVAWL